MLDSSDMTPSKFERSFKEPGRDSLRPIPAPSAVSFGRLGILALFFSLPLAPQAQQTSQTAPSQSSSSCADPLADPSSCLSTDAQGSRSLMMMPSANGSTQPRVSSVYNDATAYGSQGQLSATQSQLLARRLPPEPLTEFQRFVASTTGEILPIYGAELFRNIPSTFAPVDMAPVPSDFVVGPGDELRIRVWGQVSFEADLRVDRSGEIYLPHVGPVHVAGLQFAALDGQLRQAVGRVYRNFDLTVNFGQIRSIQVYIAGQARRPGVYTVSGLSTLVDALFASGGPSVQGSLRHVQLRRGGVTVTDFDLYDLIARGDKSKDVKLLSGDVVYIPPVGRQVALVGSVRAPAIYELDTHDSLGDIIADAGGVTAVASNTRIAIERIQDHRDREAMEVAFDKAGLATSLADGDIVRVTSILPSYSKTVTIRGNLANPGRFAWHPGMHVSELIPDKNALTTRDYWWRRTLQGLPAPEFEPSVSSAYLRQPVEPVQVTPGMQMPGSALSSAYPCFNPYNSASPYSSTPYASPQTAQNGEAQAYPLSPEQQAAGCLGQYPGSLQQLNAQAMGQPGQALQAGPYASNQPGTAAGASQTQALTAGNTTLATQESTRYSQFRTQGGRNEIRIVAPEIDWDYASIERRNSETLKTEVVPFDLGKLVLNHDASQDLELQPGDVVTIFSEADIHLPVAQQTKLVKLEGEFAHAGSYTARPGETLRQLVERAGGFTPAAYLYGSLFSREATRTVQQARIDEYVNNLEMEMQRGTLAAAASAVSSPQDIAQNTAAEASSRELINHLRQVRATGRIVLDFKPNTTGTASVPDITLEDGDTFIVPSMPSAVNVLGAVYNQNSFLFDRTKRVGDYLRLAGGPNRSADRRHEFVIRADGEVISRNNHGSAWNNSFDNLHLNPGDTIIVPDKTFKPSAIRGVLDWTQMFSSMAFGVAALSVLP